MSPYRLALAHYRLQFPNLESLGGGTPPAAWKTEYDRVSSVAFSNLLLTHGAFEGGTGTGEKLFDQEVLLEALHDRRGELDEDYDWRAEGNRLRHMGIRATVY